MKSGRGKALLDLLFPRNIHCLLCGRHIMPGEPYSLCGECRGRLSLLKDGACCPVCGRLVSAAPSSVGCPECAGRRFHFDRAVSALAYDDFSRRLVFELKYRKRGYVAFHLAEMIRDRMAVCPSGTFDVLIPVPAGRKRLRKRGFNQALLLAEALGEMRGEPVENRALRLEKTLMDQVRLDREKRFENLKNAFCAAPEAELHGRRVLLVDDVLTTGATADACARALKAAGAATVVVATVASR